MYGVAPFGGATHDEATRLVGECDGICATHSSISFVFYRCGVTKVPDSRRRLAEIKHHCTCYSLADAVNDSHRADGSHDIDRQAARQTEETHSVPGT